MARRWRPRTLGSELNTLVRKTLAFYGLPADRYDLLPIGATNNRYTALTQGAVDATLLSVPLTFDAEARGMKYLGTTGDAVPSYMFTTDRRQARLVAPERRRAGPLHPRLPGVPGLDAGPGQSRQDGGPLGEAERRQRGGRAADVRHLYQWPAEEQSHLARRRHRPQWHAGRHRHHARIGHSQAPAVRR